MRRLSIIVSGLILLAVQCSCTTPRMGNTPPSESGDETPPIPVPETEYEYLVSPKDVLQIAIVNEGELGTTFEVNEKDGTINYPFIEYVKVAGLTVKQIEKLITEKLKEGEWFVEPQVNVMVLKYSEKFFYVQGQVNKPGQYSFTGENEMTVHRAIIKAGGFTRIASKKVILLTSDEQGNKKRLEVDVGDIIKNRIPDPLVKADDIIYVRESFL